MTAEEFNEKYKQYIPEGWYGLGFNISDVTDYLDKVMEELILIPGFELHQIKLKFNMARFYFQIMATESVFPPTPKPKFQGCILTGKILILNLSKFAPPALTFPTVKTST